MECHALVFVHLAGWCKGGAMLGWGMEWAGRGHFWVGDEWVVGEPAVMLTQDGGSSWDLTIRPNHKPAQEATQP